MNRNQCLFSIVIRLKKIHDKLVFSNVQKMCIILRVFCISVIVACLWFEFIINVLLEPSTSQIERYLNSRFKHFYK